MYMLITDLHIYFGIISVHFIKICSHKYFDCIGLHVCFNSIGLHVCFNSIGLHLFSDIEDYVCTLMEFVYIYSDCASYHLYSMGMGLCLLTARQTYTTILILVISKIDGGQIHLSFVTVL